MVTSVLPPCYSCGLWEKRHSLWRKIVLKVTEVENLKDLAVSEDEIKRTELCRIKSEKGFKNVDNILKTSCSQDYINKKKPGWSDLQRSVW